MSDIRLPIHPRTGLIAVGIVNGKPIWPIRGGDGTGDGGGTGSGGGNAGGTGDGGGSGGSQGGSTYTPPGSQADLDRIVEQRLARERAKFADYDDLKAKAEKHDALEFELGSDKEKAVKTARDEETAKVRGEWAPRVVRAEFKAAAKGVLTDDQVKALLEDLDLSKYLDTKGEPDEEKISTKIKAFAPAGNGNNGSGKPPISLGQGPRNQSTAQPGDQARAQLAKRFPSKAGAQQK